MEGTPFGRYQLLSLLGRGGMGEVWRAHDTATDRIVAIKTLPAQYSDNPTFHQRFRREAQAAARLNSPHVIPIHDYGEIDGRLYVTMRLVEGRDLQAVITDGPMQPGRAVRIIEQVAKALHAAHKVGLVHRDVKPSNVLLDEDDFAYLIDFGIAKAVGETGLTNTGATIGTWAYMAPERFTTTAEANSSSDVYALACVLYECLTGHMPYPGSGIEHFYHGHVYGDIPKVTTKNAEIPGELDSVIATGMAKFPHQRFPTTKDLASAARTAISSPPHSTAAPAAGKAAPYPHTRRPLVAQPRVSGIKPAPATRQPPPIDWHVDVEQDEPRDSGRTMVAMLVFLVVLVVITLILAHA